MEPFERSYVIYEFLKTELNKTFKSIQVMHLLVLSKFLLTCDNIKLQKCREKSQKDHWYKRGWSCSTWLLFDFIFSRFVTFYVIWTRDNSVKYHAVNITLETFQRWTDMLASQYIPGIFILPDTLISNDVEGTGPTLLFFRPKISF